VQQLHAVDWSDNRGGIFPKFVYVEKLSSFHIVCCQICRCITRIAILCRPFSFVLIIKTTGITTDFADNAVCSVGHMYPVHQRKLYFNKKTYVLQILCEDPELGGIICNKV